MEHKKQLGEEWKSQEQEIAECRLLYYLWAIIEEEAIEMQEFKELVMILVEKNSNRASFIS